VSKRPYDWLAERIEQVVAVLPITHRDDLLRRSSVMFLPQGYSSCLCLILRRSPCGPGTGYACACL